MFKISDISYENFNLKILQSDIFSDALKHFFSTRLGGDTPAPLNSFTLSAKDFRDYTDYEIKNQKIACEILGGNYENFIMPNQQHTDKIAIIKNYDDIKKTREEAFDGIVTNLKNFPVCLVFADCTPVLLFDEKKRVLACVHAGWKGTAKNIVEKAVKIMKDEFSSNVDDIKAAIGATICQKCFEVNADVALQLSMSIKNNCGNMISENNGKMHVDLKQLNKVQLNNAGVTSIDICNYCTCCDNDIFYSYRADNKCTGRHGMLAMIKE